MSHFGQRILVVGGDSGERAQALAVLAAAGFGEVEAGSTLLRESTDAVPDLLVIVGDDVVATCAQAREPGPYADVPVLAVIAALPAELARDAIAAGADDIVLRRPSPAVMGGRVRVLLRAAASRRTAREAARSEEALLRIHELLADGGDSPEALHDVLLVAAERMEFDRCALVAHVEASDQAYVIAATEDPGIAKIAIAIDDYPELVAAMRSRAPLFIHDGQEDPVTAPVAAALARKGVRGIAVFPVRWRQRSLGALLFRRGAAGVPGLGGRAVGFGRQLAGLLAAQLHDGRVLASLGEQTHRLSRARVEAERRMRAVESLKEYFEAASDSVVVLDEEGRILYLNRTAEGITGFARDGLVGTSLTDLVGEAQRDPLAEVVRRVLAGHNLDAFDLEITTTSGDPITVSVTTSTVLSRNRAVILSFRDVTAERALETELRKTKEFLEKLIDSTVDAIIAADGRGQVILFNSGAERLFGYPADAVIGRVPVWKLYPEGVARQVMRMLRSTSYGGVGRLEPTRREVLSRVGEVIPVNMTASIVYEEGREVATVGIFSDLRERIRIEQRLLQAQEKLEVSEKQALVAELAGAAAHELNQPLTSIMGYAQLALRQSAPDDRGARPLGIILHEAERMAEIVRKIGRITRFETKEYVGSASILDLDKAAREPGEPAAAPAGPTDDATRAAR